MPIYEYALDTVEKVKLQKFISEHQTYCPRIKIDNEYSLRFSTDSGIGVSVQVICSTCGQRHDITDYNTW